MKFVFKFSKIIIAQPVLPQGYNMDCVPREPTLVTNVTITYYFLTTIFP